MSEVEELAEIINKYHIGCNLPIECFSECGKCCAKAILAAGYCPVEPVQLGMIDIAHNEAKGQLYRERS